MRINIYSQEITDEISRVTKLGTDDKGNPAQFHAVRLYLHSAPQLHHTAEDDDRSAVTIWLPRSLARRVELAIALRAMAGWIEGPWPGGWAGWQDGPETLAVKAEVEHRAEDAAQLHNASVEAEASWPPEDRWSAVEGADRPASGGPGPYPAGESRPPGLYRTPPPEWAEAEAPYPGG